MKKQKGAKDKEKAEIATTTIEVDREYDIIDELESTIDEIETTIEEAGIESLSGTLSYMRFLIKKLEDSLSDGFEQLRRQRFIPKTSE